MNNMLLRSISRFLHAKFMRWACEKDVCDDVRSTLFQRYSLENAAVDILVHANDMVDILYHMDLQSGIRDVHFPKWCDDAEKALTDLSTLRPS
jgi:hypothetical protein